MIAMMRADGVRTVRVGDAVGQPRLARRADPAPARVRAPAPRARAELRAGARRRPLRPRARAASRSSRSGGWAPARRSTSRARPPSSGGASRSSGVLSLGVEGIKADDGEGYYIPDDVRLADGRTGAEAAWALGGLHRLSLQRALDEVHPGAGVLFGRSGWTGQHAIGHTWGGDQASDFWSLRVLVVATLTAACSGFSNWSHDVGGYLGHRLVERCPPELLVRWLQFGCFTPLMQAHARMPQEPWHYGERGARPVPRLRAPARAARPLRARGRGDGARSRPADHPAAVPDRSRRSARLDDHRRLRLRAGAVGRAGARRRRPRARGRAAARRLDRDVVGARVRGGGEVVVPAPLQRIPVWVRAGRSSSPTRPSTSRAGSATSPSRAAARGDAVGRAAAREHGGATGRRDPNPLAARAVVGTTAGDRPAERGSASRGCGVRSPAVGAGRAIAMPPVPRGRAGTKALAEGVGGLRAGGNGGR